MSVIRKYTSMNAGAAGKNMGFLPALRNGLIGHFRFDQGQAAIGVDYSPIKVNASTVGAGFVYNAAGYSTVNDDNSAGNGLTTSVLDTNGRDFTLFAIVRTNDGQTSSANEPVYVSNYNSPDTNNPLNTGPKGLTFTSQVTTGLPESSLYVRDQGWNGSSLSTIGTNYNDPNFSVFKAMLFVRQTVAGVTTRTLYDLTAGTSVTGTSTTSPIAQMTQSFCIGFTPSNKNGGAFDTICVSFWSRALDASASGEVQSTLLPLERARAALNGFSI